MSIKVLCHLENGFFEENSFIITDEATGKNAIVDPCFEAFSFETFPEKFEYILLTHGHFDHMAHTHAIKEKCGGKIVAHEKELVILEDPNLNLTSMFGQEIIIKPDIIVKDGDELDLGETKIKVFHTPGHTAGSVCYIIDDKIFTGDTVMASTVGRCDLPTGDFSQMKSSIEKIKLLDDEYTLYCGHGSNTSLSEEKKYNPYFR